MKNHTSQLITLTFLLVAHSTLLAVGAEWTLKVTDKHPPAEFDASISELLQPQAIQLLNGDKPIYEFWIRTELPIKTKPTSAKDALEAIKDTTLVGAALIHASGQRDYKDNEILAGSYTMRFGLQPVDGDHLGSSLFPYFLILIPATVDTKPDAITRSKQMSKASGKPTATGHPVVLSLRPAAPADQLPALVEPEEEHKAIHLALNARPADEDPLIISFELVFAGHGEIQ